jgi:pimeloyl-ACP methyl ester carboxylesterase
MRAHRAFRQLALLLSGAGFHVLRFDYSGTGDSAGEPHDVSLARWDADVGTAVEELMDIAAVESVWVVGLRLGGALALRAASRPAVRGVVLWDPVTVGTMQLREARATYEGNGAGVLELGGVPIVPSLFRELASVDLMTTSIPQRLKCLVAVSDDTETYRALHDRLRRDGAEVAYRCVPSDGRWSEFDNWGSALIPQALIRAIVDYLQGTVQ